jgi:hypothetical protein
VNEQLSELIEQLTRQTEAGRRKWEGIGRTAYRIEVGHGLIRVSSGSAYVPPVSEGDEWQIPSYLVTVSNALGEIVEDEEVTVNDTTNYPKLDRLFKAARRSATNGDHLLKGMLTELSRT